MQIPDTTICSLCRQKNRKGLEYLFQMYYRPLVVWADTFVNDIGGAEDLVQEFFIHIWEKELLDGVKPETLKSYLYTFRKDHKYRQCVSYSHPSNKSGLYI